MQTRLLKRFGGYAAIAAFAFVLIGCNGSAGQNGAAGATGATGATGPAGPGGPAGPAASTAIDITLMSPETWEALEPKGTITSVTIASPPVVNFTLTDANGNGLKGFGAATSKASTATLTSYPNLAFALAKLVPEDTDSITKAPSKWVSYIVTSTPNVANPTVVPTRPTTDNTGTLVDNGDGTYRYTFYRDITQTKAILDAATYAGNNIKADLGDTTYVPTLTHRLAIQFSGNARGTGSNTADGVTVTPGVPMKKPINLIYDFIPATGLPVTSAAIAREVVAVQNCNECHQRFASFHGGARNETRFCVVCHTDQRKYGQAEATTTATGYSGSTSKINGAAVGDFPRLIHKIHQGQDLTKTGYNYANVLFNDIGFSFIGGGQKMCLKCHDNAPQSTNFASKASIMACGSCHDNVNFATAENHAANRPTTDGMCFSCHGDADVKLYHMTENITPHNPAVAAGLVNFKYELSTVTASATNVVIKFRILGDTTTTPTTPVVFVPAAASVSNPLTGFTGSPGFLLSWAMPQDGIATPADYNNLGSGLSNFQPISVSIAQLLSTNNAATMGSLAGPDGSGYYTATLVGTKIFPVGATLRAIGLQSYFTQITAPGTPTAGIGRHAVSVIKAVTGDTVRRTVVDQAKCANCHEWFEGHGGSRVATTQLCVQCHLPGLTTSGRGISDAVLETYRGLGRFTARDTASLASWGITIPNPVVPGSNFALNFPQVTNNFKDMIHGIHAGKDRTEPIRIVRDRTPTAITLIHSEKIGFPGFLNNCETCHVSSPTSNTKTYNTVALNTLSSRQIANNGAIVTPADAKASLMTANATDKMTTPFAASCVSCHDSTPTKAHIGLMGGQILVDRSVANPANESCAVCHGPGADFDTVKMHK